MELYIFITDFSGINLVYGKWSQFFVISDRRYNRAQVAGRKGYCFDFWRGIEGFNELPDVSKGVINFYKGLFLLNAQPARNSDVSVPELFGNEINYRPVLFEIENSS